jgi:ABC-type dipeptide/oligopeptide/nickel transport system ATPase component
MDNIVLLSIQNLTVQLGDATNAFYPVKGVCFHLEEAETLAIVGESGSGKTMTALALLGLLPAKASVVSGVMRFRDAEYDMTAPKNLHHLRGKSFAMIFQDPQSALNPVFKIGTQFVDILKAHRNISRNDALQFSKQILQEVGFSAPEQILNAYPHQLSGGMAQRCMIAMALLCQPQLIIADEPTTALDYASQQHLLELLKSSQQKYGFGMLFISHDLQVVESIADKIAVMQNGEIVEQNTAQALINSPRHHYTRQLTEAFFGYRAVLQQIFS